MLEYRLTEAEEKLAEIIWEKEPISSPDLVKLCQGECNWKKSTTYTILRRICNKKIFKNKDSIVTSLIKRDDFYGEQSKIFVKENFDGSLPKFLAAFSKTSKLSHEEIQEIQQLIIDHKEGE